MVYLIFLCDNGKYWDTEKFPEIMENYEIQDIHNLSFYIFTRFRDNKTRLDYISKSLDIFSSFIVSLILLIDNSAFFVKSIVSNTSFIATIFWFFELLELCITIIIDV